MEQTFEVQLTGPAKVGGKREKSGASVFVTREELADLVSAKAVAPDTLEMADQEATEEQLSQSDDAEKAATALQSLNEDLVAKVNTLKSELAMAEDQASDFKKKLERSEAEKNALDDETVTAKRTIEGLQVQIAKLEKPTSEIPADTKAETTSEPASKTPKPASKASAKSTGKKPAKS